MHYEQLKAQVPKVAELPELKVLDKNGHFYHAVQRAANRDFIFDFELGQYRHNLLCRLCGIHDVSIIASVVMNNHTHDLLMADTWENIHNVMRLMNTSVAHSVRKRSKKFTNGHRVFESTPYYRAIRSIEDLMVTIKYIFDNMRQVEVNGGAIPFSCFWSMARGYLPKSYGKSIYLALFGMTEIELFNFLNENSMQDVVRLAHERFQSWTPQDNANTFMLNPDIPWLPTQV